MNAQMLFLKPDQVPLGMLTYVCAPDTSTPETDDKGNLLPPLKLLLGGVPTRAKWYIYDTSKGSRAIAGFEYNSIRDGARFTPVESFSADDAPVRKEYAVFVNGERLKYDDYPKEFVKLAKVTDGCIVSFNGYAYDHWLCEFKLPKNAILVPTGDFASEWDFGLLGCIGIPKPSAEQRVKLENLGITFFDHSPFGKRGELVSGMSVNFSFRDYSAVRLPQGWSVVESKSWYFRCPHHIEIRDSEKRPIARIHQEPSEYTRHATWTGTLELV